MMKVILCTLVIVAAAAWTYAAADYAPQYAWTTVSVAVVCTCAGAAVEFLWAIVQGRSSNAYYPPHVPPSVAADAHRSTRIERG